MAQYEDFEYDVLVIGEGAEVDGTIEVGCCIVTGGVVRASIRAVDAIELHAPAEVYGDLHAPNIFIDRGVQFEGSCKMAPLSGRPPPPRSPLPSTDLSRGPAQPCRRRTCAGIAHWSATATTWTGH